VRSSQIPYNRNPVNKLISSCYYSLQHLLVFLSETCCNGGDADDICSNPMIDPISFCLFME
jgi:hypothetical protein